MFVTSGNKMGRRRKLSLGLRQVCLKKQQIFSCCNTSRVFSFLFLKKMPTTKISNAYD